MKFIKTLYYHIKGTNNSDENNHEYNYIKAQVYYDEGGYSIFGGDYRPRGYYTSAYPVGRWKDNIGWSEMTQIFGGGAKCTLFEVSRQSQKKEREAVEMFDRNIDEYLKKVYSDMEFDFVTDEKGEII